MCPYIENRDPPIRILILTRSFRVKLPLLTGEDYRLAEWSSERSVEDSGIKFEREG